MPTTRERRRPFTKVLDQQLERPELLSDLFYRSRFESKKSRKRSRWSWKRSGWFRMIRRTWSKNSMKHTLGSHPLGRPILGQAPRIQALGRKDLCPMSARTMIRNAR